MLPVNSATNLRLVFCLGPCRPPPLPAHTKLDRRQQVSYVLKNIRAPQVSFQLCMSGEGGGRPKTKLALRLLPGGLIFRYQPKLDSFVLVRKIAPMVRTCVSRDGGCVAAGKQTTLKIVAGWIDFQVAT